MDFDIDEQQRMLQTTARDFLRAECDKSVVRRLEAGDTGHSPGLWKKMAELGWTGLIVPESYGGVGLGLLDLAILFEEIGRAAFDSPLFATAMGTMLVLEAGADDQKQDLLPGIVSGESILTVALAEPEVSNDFRFVSARAEAAAGGYVVKGTKMFVPYATVASDVVVLARTRGKAGDEQGLTLFAADAKAPGIEYRPLGTIAPDKQFRADLDGVRIAADRILGREHQAWPALRAAIDKAAAVKCAEMVGNAQHELEVTAEYAKGREQFGRPLGTFQAVQHHLANMFTDVQGARWTTYQAVSRLSRGLPAARELAIARAFTADAVQRVAFLAQQIHGGVGVDMSNDLQFYYRRAKAMELQFGAAAVHLDALEKEIGLE